MGIHHTSSLSHWVPIVCCFFTLLISVSATNELEHESNDLATSAMIIAVITLLIVVLFLALSLGIGGRGPSQFSDTATIPALQPYPSNAAGPSEATTLWNPVITEQKGTSWKYLGDGSGFTNASLHGGTYLVTATVPIAYNVGGSPDPLFVSLGISSTNTSLGRVVQNVTLPGTVPSTLPAIINATLSVSGTIYFPQNVSPRIFIMGQTSSAYPNSAYSYISGSPRVSIVQIAT